MSEQDALALRVQMSKVHFYVSSRFFIPMLSIQVPRIKKESGSRFVTGLAINGSEFQKHQLVNALNIYFQKR
jgi:hypothetical protein